MYWSRAGDGDTDPTRGSPCGACVSGGPACAACVSGGPACGGCVKAGMLSDRPVRAVCMKAERCTRGLDRNEQGPRGLDRNEQGPRGSCSGAGRGRQPPTCDRLYKATWIKVSYLINSTCGRPCNMWNS